MSLFSQLFRFHGKTAESQDESGEEQREMIEGIEHLSEKIVRDVMVPRTDTVCVEDTTPVDEMLEILVESGTRASLCTRAPSIILSEYSMRRMSSVS